MNKELVLLRTLLLELFEIGCSQQGGRRFVDEILLAKGKVYYQAERRQCLTIQVLPILG
jgi:hypothetical protein